MIKERNSAHLARSTDAELFIPFSCRDLTQRLANLVVTITYISSILDLDPEKSLECQRPKEEECSDTAASDGKDDGPALKDHPKYQKFYKMLRMGLPKETVRHAMTRDGLDPGYVFDCSRRLVC